MKKTEKTSGFANFNVGSETRYVVYLPNIKRYLHTWTSTGWQATLCEKQCQAWTANTMTTALLIGFCLGFGSGMEIQLVKGQPEELL